MGNMGCGNSKSIPVTPEILDTPNRQPSEDSTDGVDENFHTPDHVSTPIEEVDLISRRRSGTGGEGGWQFEGTEVKETAPLFKRGSIDDINGRRKLNGLNTAKGSAGRRENLAFEVPALDDQGGDSLIKKFPPKKFQKLEEQQSEQQLSQELLEEKQAIAERRRQEILSKRIKSAKTASARSAQARARVAENKEVDKLDDAAIESANYTSSDPAGL